MELTDQILELLSQKKYAALQKLLNEMNPIDLAELLSELPDDKRPILFRLLNKEQAAECFVEMDHDIQRMLIHGFSDVELRSVLDEMFLDDTVDLVEEMPANVVKRILANADGETRKGINEILNYPDDSAGSIMTVEFVELKEHMTITEAFDTIKTTGVDKETIYTCYVTDSNRHLIGVVTVKDMLLSKVQTVGELMETNIISVNTLEDREDVGTLFLEYGLMALPVVDKESRLVGIVTYDDAMDVISEEREEDIQVMAAITPTDERYLKTSVFSIWKSRIPWLLLLMISATFTGMIITGFENALASSLALTAFIPMLMDTGGNSGSQASVTVIRGLSLNEIEFRDIFRVQWKELRVAFFCGLTLAAASFIKILLVDMLLMHTQGLTILVSLVVCLTLFTTVVVAKFIGCTLPIIAQKIGFDPAVMASPFITTIVDAVSLLVYFGIASSLLNL
ncbi:MAG: magnesium transporter [Eubacteriales bacterium]